MTRAILSAVLALASGLLPGCTPTAAPPHPGAAARTGAGGAQVTAIVDVSVVPIATDGVLEHQTLLVERGIIVKLGPASAVGVPEGAFVVDAAGKYAMPGMADMHVHLPGGAAIGDAARILDLSLAHGVTFIRGMQGAPEQLGLRERLRVGDVPAPALFLGGPPIAASLDVAAARDTVRAQKAAGYDFVKVLGGFDRPAYEAIVATARELGIPVSGHVPADIGIDAALAARQSTIEHLMGYRGVEALDDLARRTRDAGVSNCATLDYFAIQDEPDVARLLQRDGLRFVPKEQIAAWVKERDEDKGNARRDDHGERLRALHHIVSALQRAGARLLVGSDTPGAFSVPGFAYDEELRQLTRAGLPPYAVLRAATLSAAEVVGGEPRFGVIAAGARADLVLLDGNPLESVDNVAHPAGVMVRGHWLSREELEKRVERYAQK